MEFDKVIRDRQSVRVFNENKVDDDIIKKILDAGIIAPTAKNLQPQKIFVLKSDDAIKKINEASPCIYNAKTVLLVCSDKENAFKRSDGYSTYEMDAVISATHMMLEATNLGVDNIWIELFDKKKIKELFKLKEELEPICLIPLGYKKDNYQSPNHLKRKDIKEIVKYL